MRKSKYYPLRQSVRERIAHCSPSSEEDEMPLLKGTAGKAMPDMAIGYITRKDKVKYIDVQNLFIDEDYAAQFKETAARFGKYTDYDERKYYHFKLSPDRADHADPLMVQEYAKACAEKMFEGCECVIATHTDTQTVHCHIVVNAVRPLTGRKLHFNDDEYAGLKDMANEIGEEFGFSSLDFRKKAENNRTQDERHIILKGGTSWKEDLREVIAEGILLASDESEFFALLAKYGVKVTRSGKDYSYLHPEKSKAVRGQKLGDNYTKREVLSVIEKHGNRTGGYAVGTVAEDQRDTESGNGKRTFERGVGDLKREMQRINRQAEYAHRGLDYERERDKERQQILPEKAERERAERSQRDTRDNAGREKIQSGSKSNHKERDWSNSR